MAKTITSPSKRWPGTVILSDPLSMPQVMAFEDAIQNAREQAIEHGNTVTVKDKDGVEKEAANAMSARYMNGILPGICVCVEKWELQGLPEKVTPDIFPGSPKMDSAELLAWLIREITELYRGAETVPNA
jgi:hypothetical protein